MVFNVLFKIGFTEVFQVIKIEEKELQLSVTSSVGSKTI